MLYMSIALTVCIALITFKGVNITLTQRIKYDTPKETEVNDDTLEKEQDKQQMQIEIAQAVQSLLGDDE